METKLSGEGAGKRRERALTIFLALRLAWRNPRKVILRPSRDVEGEKRCAVRGRDLGDIKRPRAAVRVWENDLDMR